MTVKLKQKAKQRVLEDWKPRRGHVPGVVSDQFCFKTWGMFGRCVNDDNWVTRIVQAVAITPGCWWRYVQAAVCAVELVLACRNPGWDWKFFPNFSIIVMLEIIMKTSSQPRPWPAASTGTSELQCWHQCTLFSQCLENAPTFNYGHLC